jgi:hypothetical protein
VNLLLRSARHLVFGPLNGVETLLLIGCHARRHTARKCGKRRTAGNSAAPHWAVARSLAVPYSQSASSFAEVPLLLAYQDRAAGHSWQKNCGSTGVFAI